MYNTKGAAKKDMAKKMGVIEDTVARLKRGVSVVVFPEGTRSSLPDAEMLPFQKGPFLIAQMSGCRIVPVSISHSGELMPTDCIFPLRPGLGLPRIHVHPAIDPQGYSVKELQKEVRSIIESEIEKPLFPLSSRG